MYHVAQGEKFPTLTLFMNYYLTNGIVVNDKVEITYPQ